MGRKIIKKTFILTLFSILSKLLGFYYRIFLTNTIGAAGVGIYLMILPVVVFFAAISTAGCEIAMSKTVSANIDNKEATSIKLKTGLIFGISLSFLSMFLFVFTIPLICGVLDYTLEIKKLMYVSVIILPLMTIHSIITGYYFGKKKPLLPGICIFF